MIGKETHVDAQRQLMLALNLVGGVAVLGSYAHGLLTHPETRGALWGDVPASLVPVYTVSMLLAAVGYLPLFSYLFFQVDPAQARIAGGWGYPAFNLLFALVLLPSALWMPLTFWMIDQPGRILWWAIRVDLWLVGLGALGLLVALLTVSPRAPTAFHWAAVGGALALFFQTGVLDAFVWPAYFPVKQG